MSEQIANGAKSAVQSPYVRLFASSLFESRYTNCLYWPNSSADTSGINRHRLDLKTWKNAAYSDSPVLLRTACLPTNRLSSLSIMTPKWNSVSADRQVRPNQIHSGLVRLKPFPVPAMFSGNPEIYLGSPRNTGIKTNSTDMYATRPRVNEESFARTPGAFKTYSIVRLCLCC